MQNTQQRVKAVICHLLAVHEDDVTPEANLKEDLGADSLDMVELVMEFEKEFDISISDDAVENVDTVQQAIDLVDNIITNKK